MLDINTIKIMQNITERDEHKTRLMENSFTELEAICGDAINTFAGKPEKNLFADQFLCWTQSP